MGLAAAVVADLDLVATAELETCQTYLHHRATTAAATMVLHLTLAVRVVVEQVK
jgi:hypothetical protein